MALRFEPVPLDRVPWEDLDRRPDRTVHQTRPWLEFLRATQGARPIVLRMTDGGQEVGWFTGATVRRWGVTILGSPMRGWSTAHMGFNLDEGGRIVEAVTALAADAWTRGCWHLELLDRRLDGPAPDGFRATELHGLEVPLQLDDDELLGQMTGHGRRDVRRSQRLGADVEQVDTGFSEFAREHHAQAVEVFARSGRRPPYDVARIDSMIRHLHPAGRVVLLRARDPDGTPIASAIYAGLPGGTASFTLHASHASGHRWSPNELIVWHGMRAWRERGALRFDLGGRNPDSPKDFKAKFGGEPTTTQWVRRSRTPVLERGRDAAMYLRRRRSRQRRTSGSGRSPLH